MAGALLTALYAVGTVRINLPRYFPEPGITVDFVKMLGPTWQETTRLYVGFVLGAFALYAVALWVVRRPMRGRPPRLLLFGFPVLFAAALLGMYPPTAVDLIHYHADARTLWVHGQNPLLVPPAANPYPVGMSWSELPSPYGPLWSLLTGAAVIPTGDHFVRGLIGLKAIAAASYLASTWLIWRVVARVRPGDEALAVVLFAWNPFVVMRVVGAGHNDMVMMAFVLFALERAQVRDWRMMLPALACSVLVKYVSALLVPAFLLYAWRHAGSTTGERASALTGPATIAFTASLLAFVPFWEGLSTFDAVRGEASRLITSTPLLVHVLAAGEPGEGEIGVATRPLRLAFVGAAAVLAWHARRDEDYLITACCAILLLYLAIAASWFRPWYFLWPVALGALRPRSWLAPVLLAVTFAGSFPDLIEQFRGHWGWLDSYESQIAAPVLVAFAPLVAVWLAGALRHGSWHIGVPARGEEPATKPPAEV